jgi:hypothetical protein
MTAFVFRVALAVMQLCIVLLRTSDEGSVSCPRYSEICFAERKQISEYLGCSTVDLGLHSVEGQSDTMQLNGVK